MEEFDGINLPKAVKQEDGTLAPSDATIVAWGEKMLDKAVRNMDEMAEPITPFRLSAYIQHHENLPFTEVQAKQWLEKQVWYKQKE